MSNEIAWTSTGNGSGAGAILAGSEEILEAYHVHPFVRGIADGTLPEQQFKHFMIQDYLYLFAYAKVFSIGAAKAEDVRIQQAFSGYVSQILNGEMEIHRKYMQRLGISPAEAEQVSMALDAVSYTSYMLRIAYEGGPAEVCAAILPCAVSYERIAQRMVEENPSCRLHPFYGEWVSGYASADYHEENEELKRITDLAVDGASPAQMAHLITIGQICSRYEGAFWDMAWELRR